MDKKFKIVAILPLVAMAMVAVGALFGGLAAWDVSQAIGDDGFFYTFLTIIIIASAILIFSNLMAFFGVRKGRVKTALLGLGRSSILQFIGPGVALVLALIGLNKQSAAPGFTVFVVATFVIALIATGMNMRSLKAFRKDKENYSYATVIAFISAGTLFLFLIAALIGAFQIGANPEIGHAVGFGITFSVLFVLADIVSYVALGILCKMSENAAPETTLQDASTDDLKKVLKESLAESNGTSVRPNHVSTEDKVKELREFKKLLDEGIITQAEFDQKKKELLR